MQARQTRITHSATLRVSLQFILAEQNDIEERVNEENYLRDKTINLALQNNFFISSISFSPATIRRELSSLKKGKEINCSIKVFARSENFLKSFLEDALTARMLNA